MEKVAFTVAEVMEMTHLSQNTLYELLKTGKIKGVKIGVRKWLIPRSSLEKLLGE